MEQNLRTNWSEDLQAIYANRFSSESERKHKNDIWNILCKNYFQKFIPGNANILDLASGYCEFINNISSEGGIKYAIDVNSDIQKYANDDVNIFISDIFNIDTIFSNESIDIVFISNFLEHLDTKQDILNLLMKIHKILKKNGQIIILQPNIRYVGNAYWDFIDHKCPLTEKSLIEGGESTGFKVLKVVKKFLPYTTKSKIPKWNFLIKVYIKLMPISGYFMGKQSLVIFLKAD